MNCTTKQQIQQSMIDRLCKNAKGHAQSILLDKNMPDEQRQAEFEVIEEFVEYIRDYEDNTKALQEYAEWKIRYTDDGR